MSRMWRQRTVKVGQTDHRQNQLFLLDKSRRKTKISQGSRWRRQASLKLSHRSFKQHFLKFLGLALKIILNFAWHAPILSNDYLNIYISDIFWPKWTIDGYFHRGAGSSKDTIIWLGLPIITGVRDDSSKSIKLPLTVYRWPDSCCSQVLIWLPAPGCLFLVCQPVH